MDRFLRYNRSGGSNATTFGGQSTAQPTIIVQPSEPPPIPAFIQNQSLEARVACDPSNLPALEATVRGRQVFQSSYGDGTDGFTAIRSPSLNTGISLDSDGMRMSITGSGAGGAVLTNEDASGLVRFRYPSRLYPTDNNDLYNFIQCNLHGTDISVNYEQPTGKLRIQTQAIGTPGQVLTLEDNTFSCKWMDPPPVPPSPTIYVSNVAIPIANSVTPTPLYPGIQLLSTTEFWSATVDTTFVITGGPAVSVDWTLFNILGTQIGPTVSTAVTAAGAIIRITYQYTFRQVSPTEIRMTATSTILNGTTVIVRLPVNYQAIDPLGGIPFIRMRKNAATTVNAVSMSAYYNALNWQTPAPIAPLSAMRMAMEEDAPATESGPVFGDNPNWIPLKDAVMDDPKPEEFPVDVQGVGDKEIQALADLGYKLKDKLFNVFDSEAIELQEHGDMLKEKLSAVFVDVGKELEEYAQEIKRQKLV